MRPRYKVSQAGVELIERFEGYRVKAARLADGRWTIGYGHTRSAREGAEVSRDDAGILLRYVDLPPVEEAIHEQVTAPLSQSQYDALVAFVFNIGVEAFASSDVLKRLNEGRPTEAACALELWRRAEVGGDPVVLDALIRRRAAEKALFLTPPDGFAPTPSPLVRPELDARAAEGLPKRRPVEHEAPLSGTAAEVRLVAPFEIEPPLEAPAAPAESLAAEAAAEAQEEAPKEVPSAWTGQVINFAVTPTVPEAWTVQPTPAREAEVEAAQPQDAPAEPAAEPEAAAEAAPEAAAPEAAPAAEPEAFAGETAADSTSESTPEPTSEPTSEPAPDAATAAEPEAAEAPAAEPVAPEAVAPEPDAPRVSVLPGPPTRAIPASEPPASRPIFSSYGPMAFAVRPPEPRPAEPATAPARDGEGTDDSADADPHPAPAAPVSTAASEAQVLAEAAAAPVVTAEAQAPQPHPQPLVLTAPPADWEEPRGASPAMITALAAEADELETPLFDEGWDGPSALSGRIVRHEPVAEPESRGKPAGATAPYVLLGLVGFVAFAGALFAFWRGRAPGASGDPTVLAWSLALIGAACVGISVYFLLKRLGGAED